MQGSDGDACWIQVGSDLYETCAKSVGIGTSTPSRLLTVSEPNGTAVLRIEAPPGGTAAVDLEFGRIGTNSTWTLSQYADDSFRLIRNSGMPGGHTPLFVNTNGYVGIRTGAPADELHIAEAPGSTDAELRLDYSGSGGGTPRAYGIAAAYTGNFDITDKTAGSVPRLSINSAGNVGIGAQPSAAKLEVAGEVRVANSGAGCSAANEGAIRYNISSKNFEGCNGSAWAALGGSPPGTLCGMLVTGEGATANVPCNGQSILGSPPCPSGYTVQSSTLNGPSFTTCVKN